MERNAVDQGLRDVRTACAHLCRAVDDLLADMPLQGATTAQAIVALLGHPMDLVVREAGTAHRVVFLSTTVAHNRVEESVVRPLSQGDSRTAEQSFASSCLMVHTCGEAVHAILRGKVLILTQGASGGHVVAMDAWPQRPPSEPPAEMIATGPHLGFVEDLSTNVAMVRHGVPDRRLRVEHISTGSRSGTQGALVYVDGLVRHSVLAEVRRQLDAVHPSFVTDTAMLGQWLSPRSGIVFPTVGKTERPDRAVAELMAGKVLILSSGSPTTLIIPNVFADLMHVPEDYYQRSLSANFVRGIRLLGLVVSVTASPLLVAVESINHELLPGKLFLIFATNHQGLPIPLPVEVLMMEALVEVIREAGLRLPGPTGQSIAIIGAVVIGETALVAGLASAPAVVVVSLAFLASFVLPSSDLVQALRMTRFPFILLAAAFGLLGLTWGVLALIVYFCALDSFGVPYLSPLTPLRVRGLQDVLWRKPLPFLRRSYSARPKVPPTADNAHTAAPGQISAGQLFWILMLTSLPMAVLYLPGVILRSTGRFGWLTPLVVAVPCVLGGWIVGVAAGRFGDPTHAARVALGPVVGRIVLALEWVAMGAYVVIGVRQTLVMSGHTFVTAVIPLWLLAGFGLIPVGMVLWLGPVALGRTAALVGVALTVELLMTMGFLLPGVHLLWALPLRPRNAAFVGTRVLLYSAVWLAEPVFVGAALAGAVQPVAARVYGNTIALAVACIAVLTAVTMWLMVATFGPSRVGSFSLPLIPLVNGARVGPHLGHLATVVIPVEAAGSALSLAALIFVWTALTGWGDRPWHRALFMGELVVVGALALTLFHNMPELDGATYRVLARLAVPSLAVGLLMTYGVARLRSKRISGS